MPLKTFPTLLLIVALASAFSVVVQATPITISDPFGASASHHLGGGGNDYGVALTNHNGLIAGHLYQLTNVFRSTDNIFGYNSIVVRTTSPFRKPRQTRERRSRPRLLRTRKKPEVSLTAVPLTTSPGGELYPAFSPYGNQVAFSWNGEKQDNYDVYVKLIGPGEPLRLTTDPAQDYSPAWSPDGTSGFAPGGNFISDLNHYGMNVHFGSATCANDVIDGRIAPVPEPATLLLTGAGLVVVGALCRRRDKTSNL